ncbi:MAG: 3-dehydroquinate synthase [Proteobacteria bacterium]|nr:3-dehydroquinate synthase [Pseudomonadota bacterium]MDA1332333.1 3-dehydroquinate synthase [Pseudomonadota bacterium]
MKNRQINVGLGSRAYPIFVGRDSFRNKDLMNACGFRSRRYVVITNDVVGPLYFERVAQFFSSGGAAVERIIIPDGERFKTQETLTSIYDQLIEKRVDRSTTIVALGGGVVGDVAGFAAATYHRGVPLVQIPTTLLAQVDSSVGGKTAINHPAGKNLIGSFYQPQAVLIDLEMLNSLPEREFQAGLAEVVKYGAIMDEAFFVWLEENVTLLMKRDFDTLGYAVERCCASKAKIVEDDETESGSRALLNFGHTFGHAIEAGLGYGTWLHGEAVAVGMLLASRLSVLMGSLAQSDLDRIRQLLSGIGLPIDAPDLSRDRYLELMGYDKKVFDGKLRLILLKSLGEAYVTGDFPKELLVEVLDGVGR